jgi:hypothetical protein
MPALTKEEFETNLKKLDEAIKLARDSRIAKKKTSPSSLSREKESYGCIKHIRQTPLN